MFTFLKLMGELINQRQIQSKEQRKKIILIKLLTNHSKRKKKVIYWNQSHALLIKHDF